jgi:ligand-binding sensor domain-containing protein/two-component sensor histidine kinase
MQLARGLAVSVAATFLPLTPIRMWALDPSRSLTQYTRTVWTQAQGLPQDTVRAIAQTPDGYLWLGTSEGLARFDGYEFVTFTRDRVPLPSNSISTLWVDRSSNLWIGTSSGLARYSNGRFKTFTKEDGLPPGAVSAFAQDASGVVWLAAGGVLARYEGGRLVVCQMQEVAPLQSVQVVYGNSRGELWVGGIGGVAKRVGNRFVPVLGPSDLQGNMITSILQNARGTWLAGINGILLLRPDGSLRRFTTHDGLPNGFVLALCEDRAGNLWVGTYGGLSRLENDRFVSQARDNREDRDWVWSVFEDREGDLWVGMNSALNRFRDDLFTVYGRSEGLPSDEPTVLHQDARGQIWIGYHDSGLVAWSPGKLRLYTTDDGLPSNEMFAIRDTRAGDLLIASRGGVSRLHQGHFVNYWVPDPVGRRVVYDVLEDTRGHLWAATASGVYEFDGALWREALDQRGFSGIFAVTLAQGRDDSIWAGTLSDGLWRLPAGGGGSTTIYTTENGLGSNKMRSLYLDAENTLWIGTQGGGLAALRDGAFHNFTARDGLLSDTIAHIEDDGKGSLWLSTPRGICRILKQQLWDFAAGKIRFLVPENFGIENGLRSAQCAPAVPASGGGARTQDGRLWFPTGRGLAVVNPNAPMRTVPGSPPAPVTHIVEVAVNGHAVDFAGNSQWKPNQGRVQFRYAGVFLRAPERVRYSYRLEGLDSDWIPAGAQRVIDYNPLPHGRYRFLVQASLPDGGSSQAEFSFEVLPRFFETAWFLWTCGVSLALGVYGLYRLRLQRVHARFALVFQERARMAREIHDTLAQGFVGISAQLDAVAIHLKENLESASQHLTLAQKMARHSLVEARRSVMDLRTADLQEQDLPAALVSSAQRLIARGPVELRCHLEEIRDRLAPEVEQNLLRIAQEAVTNAVKHARPKVVDLDLTRENGFVHLRISDDGDGFEVPGTFSVSGGQFGIMGMRERAARCRGDFVLSSRPGAGTKVEVRIPVCSKHPKNESES